MSSHRVPAVANHRSVPGAVILLLAWVASGCAGGPVAPDTGASAVAGQPSTLQPAPTPPPGVGVASATPPITPAADQVPAEPPAAALTPLVGGRVQGDLGSYTWAGSGSDAPWLVPAPDRALRAAGPYAVSFAPPVPVEAWTARWAPVADGAAADPAGFEEGGAGPITIGGPAAPGSWTMQLDARFAGGGRAAWYWRLELAP